MYGCLPPRGDNRIDATAKVNMKSPVQTIILAAALIGAVQMPDSASAQLGLGSPGTSFELADSIALDTADGAVTAHLERAKACLADHQWDEAVETLRQVMENAENKLLGVTKSRYVSLRDYCQMQLATLPPEALKLYRSRVDPVARRWYEQGIANRDRKLLLKVVDQAFASSWGDKALMALGEMALEAGDFQDARWYWERILPVEPPPGVANTWPGYPDTHLDRAAVRARLVLVSILEGQPDRARDELAQFTRLHANARGRLGGRDVQYATALAELLTQSASWPSPKPTPDWPTFAGDFARNKIAPDSIDAGVVEWRVPLPRPGHTTDLFGVRPATVAEDHASPLSYHPAIVGDRVFVCDQSEIFTVNVATGKPVWGDTAGIYVERREDAIRELANPTGTLGTARFTMTIHGRRLYARMGSAVTSWPQQTAASSGGGSLVCLDLEAEGKLLWRITPEEGWAMEGSPVVEGTNVYAAMRRSDIRPQAHVACFDAQTGRMRWRRMICAAETPARGTLPQSTHNLLTLASGTIYYNTNLGAVAAIGADDGRIRWVSLYPRDRRGDLLRLAPHWQRDLNPCLLDRGTLLVAPADSACLFSFDAATGQILWQSGPELEDVVHLLGVAGDQLIASGRTLYWIALSGPNRGHIAHLWPDGQDKPGYGRGLLAGDSVLWPTRQKIYIFDQKTARPKKVIELAPLGITGGNLLVADGRLLISTGTELIALGHGKADGTSKPAELTTFFPK